MRKCAVMTLLLAAWVLAGCDEGPVVELKYDRPAKYEISAKVKKLAIAEFGGQGKEDKTWGDVASDLLASKLDTYNRKFNRYELVDRKRLKAIMDERDMQIMISDAGSASKAGKIANVDAMIYGTVHVMTRDENLTRTVFDPIHQTTKSVPYIRRHCMTSINFTLDDIQTSKTLCTVTAAREFDSDAKTGTMTKVLGLGGDKLPATNEVLGQQAQECVDEFLAKISPHEVCIKQALESSTTAGVSNGNKLAAAGEYKEALDLYLAATNEKPADTAAWFNAGVMYEALAKQDSANLAKAAEYYDKAVKLSPKTSCIEARKRVRAEGAAAAPAAE